MARGLALFVAAFLAVWPVAPVLAQGIDAATASPEELMALFMKQKSRGLKLAPNTGIAADPVAVATGTAETGAAAGTAETAGATTAAAAEPAPEPAGVTTAADGVTTVPVAYTEIDRTEQVNVRIEFDFDSAVLRDSEKPKLAALCTAMKTIGGDFRIVGHTDAAGTDDYNEKLSLLRAEEVKRHLVGECGLPAEGLQAVGVGRRFLFDTEDPRSDQNRRVEFQALS
jgi:outer membrane protein OmpA-like peptidoglycan-associated protein